MSVFQKIREDLESALRQAAYMARDRGALSFKELPSFGVEPPREKSHGDLAANLAFLMAREAGLPPRKVAEVLLTGLDLPSLEIARAEIAGPGFINFYFASSWLLRVLPTVEDEDEGYGHATWGRGQMVQVEFVSANPTGLLHMGNARGGALGASIASLIQATGHHVTREFYVNDAGNQIANFGLSLEARYLQLLGHDVPLPEDGYHGQDLVRTMERLLEAEGDRYFALAGDDRRRALTTYALEEKLAVMRQALEEFGVVYDAWFYESSLHVSGEVQRVVNDLLAGGNAERRDGAVWFKATAFGEEKDEVLVRQNGLATYFAADIAYHRNKLERGFHRVINIWGADHHGHVARLKAAIKALGYDPERVQIVIMQLVRLFQGGNILRMSKRTGQYVTLEELLQEVGCDAARFFFVMRSANSHLDFDLDLAKAESADNPVYYVQYAHARIASILRHAGEQGINKRPAGETRLDLLQTPAEAELIAKIAELPEVVSAAARALEPHRLTRYAQDLASLFHSFYTACRVLIDEEELCQARLALVNGTRIALRNTLHLLGITAPERM